MQNFSNSKGINREFSLKKKPSPNFRLLSDFTAVKVFSKPSSIPFRHPKLATLPLCGSIRASYLGERENRGGSRTLPDRSHKLLPQQDERNKKGEIVGRTSDAHSHTIPPISPTQSGRIDSRHSQFPRVLEMLFLATVCKPKSEFSLSVDQNVR